MTLGAVFFDIGGTLGERDAATGQLSPYPSSADLLRSMREQLGLRVGIITTLGSLSREQGIALLQGSGLYGLLDPQAFVCEHDAGVAKPDPAIYNYAAQRVQLPLQRCLYVGENLLEVIAAMAAGMQALLKPTPPGRELPL
jgi:HAD superfamily hydrolase (TIGR01509 family)